jgi:hypothetical protein
VNEHPKLEINASFASMYTDLLPNSTSQWTLLLSVSTKCQFTRIRQRAIHELNTNYEIDPVEEIVLAGQFDIPEWRIPAYEALVQREHGPTHDEADRLGIKTTVSLYMAREAVRKGDESFQESMGAASNDPPPTPSYNPERVSRVVNDIFWPTIQPLSPTLSPGLFGPHTPRDECILPPLPSSEPSGWIPSGHAGPDPGDVLQPIPLPGLPSFVDESHCPEPSDYVACGGAAWPPEDTSQHVAANTSPPLETERPLSPEDVELPPKECLSKKEKMKKGKMKAKGKILRSDVPFGGMT